MTSIDDYLALSKRAQDTALGALEKIGKSLAAEGRVVARDGESVADAVYVPCLLMCKLLRLHRAVQELVRAKLSAEGASVAITLFEIYLDLMFIGQDESRTSVWLDHQSTVYQPWGVRKKIRALFPPKSEERYGLEFLYDHLSGIKHGNPKSGQFGFPIRWQNEFVTVFVQTDDEFEGLYGNWLYALSSLLMIEGFIAGAKMLIRQNSDLDELLLSVQREARHLLTRANESLDWANGLGVEGVLRSTVN